MKSKLIIITVLLSVITFSCSQNSETHNLNDDELYNKNIIEFYKDSTFLNIDGNLYEPEIIWGSVKTYMEAYMRLCKNAEIIDNQIVCNIKKGADINISENIFEYVTDSWYSAMNTSLKQGRIEAFKSDKLEIYTIKDNSDTKVRYPGAPLKLKLDDHRGNYYGLCRYVPDTWHLYEIIDFEQSDFRGDGAGGAAIKGEIENRKAYNVFDGCAFMTGTFSDGGCYMNEIAGLRSRYEGSNYVEMWVGTHQLPLVTLKNRDQAR